LCGGSCSTFGRANFTTSARFSVSPATSSPKAAGEAGSASPLIAAKRDCLAVSAKAALISRFSRSTIYGGVLRDAYHWRAS